jgi:hypothetical protein
MLAFRKTEKDEGGSFFGISLVYLVLASILMGGINNLATCLIMTERLRIQSSMSDFEGSLL